VHMVFAHEFITHGRLKSELKNKKGGSLIIYLIKVMSFQMNMIFHVDLMVKYKWRRGM
jgi:hypothetical protein